MNETTTKFYQKVLILQIDVQICLFIMIWAIWAQRISEFAVGLTVYLVEIIAGFYILYGQGRGKTIKNNNKYFKDKIQKSF